ncbi:MAG: hypothetical protein ABSC46_13070 [Candidatus Limnocylindrales bacterium]|jgi:hypothetical protein
MNEYVSHALHHFRDAFWPEPPSQASRLASAESERAVMLQNLGLPGCSVCLAAWQRCAWQREPKDARA